MKKSLIGAALLVVSVAEARNLTFEDRVRAQEAIERVYYSHQIGATKPFEEAVPRELLEKKVATYLGQSVALEMLWHTPVTAKALERELHRMAAGTRMPERLQEVHAALGGDPFLIAECLSRPRLVDRLSRNFFAYDGRIHGGTRAEAVRLKGDLERDGVVAFAGDPRRHDIRLVRADPGTDSVSASGDPRGTTHELLMSPQEFAGRRGRLPSSAGTVSAVREEREAFVIEVLLEETTEGVRIASFTVHKRTWDDWWRQVSTSLDRGLVEAVGRSVESLPAPEGGLRFSESDFWDNGSLDDMPEPRSTHAAVWTGTHMVVWGGNKLNTGGRYDPATDTWAPTSTVGAPEGREEHTAVWTGTEMIVWGGGGVSGDLDTGGRYDPVTDTWRTTSMVNAPSARNDHTAVWTGRFMVVWGGAGPSGRVVTGGRYDPAKDTWRTTSTVGVPSARDDHTAVWTGRWMIVWGGNNGVPPYALKGGGRYDPVKDKWAPVSALAAPSRRQSHTAVWTGSEMIVWGGWGGQWWLASGGRYDPVLDRWMPTSTTGVPDRRDDHVAVWTGTRMIVWGGDLPPDSYPENTGGRYDPATDTWESTSTVSAPPGAHSATAVWSGEIMVVWGGGDGSYSVDTGGRYDPATDTWTPTSNGGAPIGRIAHSAVWTGNEMVVWGGESSHEVLDTGARYDPTTDSWTATSTDNAPIERLGHSAVWTGAAVVVWGGARRVPDVQYLDTGARYDPILDTWVWTSTVGAPTARAGHTAVWTGVTMIVWGGGSAEGDLNTGGRYDAASDSWTPVSVASAPSSRTIHTAVWTGNRMIVWGGFTFDGSFHYFDSGGAYDPDTNSWTPTAILNVPTARTGHSAVWTGDRMVVWGGIGTGGLLTNTGGQYDPVADAWTPTSQTNAPAARQGHAEVWTGSLMVVWGGGDSTGYLDTGGRYDPSADTWSATSVENAASARGLHTMVWSGSRAIVWGGLSNGFPSSGGSYIP